MTVVTEFGYIQKLFLLEFFVVLLFFTVKFMYHFVTWNWNLDITWVGWLILRLLLVIGFILSIAYELSE